MVDIQEEKEEVDEMAVFIVKETKKMIRWHISSPMKKKLMNIVFLWEGRIQRKECPWNHLGFFLQLSRIGDINEIFHILFK